MKTIAEVIRKVLDDTSNEHIVTNGQVDALTHELCAHLQRAGYAVHGVPMDGQWGGTPLRGIADVKLESSEGPGGGHGLAEFRAQLRFLFTPVLADHGDTLVRYDLIASGYTVARVEGERAHLLLKEVDGPSDSDS